MNDAFEVHFLGGHQREAFLQVKPHLVAKCADGARSGAVTFVHTGIQYMLKKLLVLLHTHNYQR